jgi:hypothetical protein
MPYPGRDGVVMAGEVRFGVRLKNCPFCNSFGVGLYMVRYRTSPASPAGLAAR